MNDNLWRRLLWLVVAFSLVAALPALWARGSREFANRQVEVVMDLDQADLLARSQGYTLPEVLGELKAAGLGAVAWSEANLDKLARAGDLTVLEGRDLLDRLASGQSPAPELTELGQAGFFNSGYTYAFTRDPVMAAWLERNVPLHLAADRYRLIRRGGLTVLEVALLKERAALLNLGFWERDIERSGAASLGLRVVARPGNVAGGDAAVAATFADLKAAAQRLGLEYSALIFGGSEATGYPGSLDATVAGLRDLGVPLALIETPEQLGNINQRGAFTIAERLGYGVVRVYSVPDVRVFAPSELADKATRSVKERGLRVVYLPPYLVVPEHLAAVDARTPAGRSLYEPPADRVGKLDYTPLVALNVNYVRDVSTQLQSQGLVLARPAPVGGPAPLAPLTVFGLALGPAAALGLAWLALRPRGRLWTLAGPAGAAAVAALLGLLALGGRAVLAAQLAALLAALTFPSLAMAFLAARWLEAKPAAGRGELARRIAADLLGALGLTLLGGLFISAVLGDVRFMLEFQYFRGVKLTYVVPVLAAVIYWVRLRHPEETEPAAWPRVIANLVRQPIRIWHAVVAAVLGGGFIIYLGRSGNTASPAISGPKVLFDRWLERMLYARPRLKEIIGYPVLVAGSWLAHTGRKTYLGWFLVGAAVSQVSVINSFEHIRTPLLLSLARAGNGLWVGALMGLVAIAVLWGSGTARRGTGARREKEGR